MDLRLDSVEGTGSWDAVDDDFMPDLIIPKTSGGGYGGSDGFLNGRAVSFEDREGRSVVFSDKFDIVVGGELYCGNKWFLNCRVDSVAYGKIVGIVRECCAISFNDNSAVAFGQNRGRRLLVLKEGRGEGRGCFGSFLSPGNGRERQDRPLWGRGCGGSWWWVALEALKFCSEGGNLVFEVLGILNMACLDNFQVFLKCLEGC